MSDFVTAALRRIDWLIDEGADPDGTSWDGSWQRGSSGQCTSGDGGVMTTSIPVQVDLFAGPAGGLDGDPGIPSDPPMGDMQRPPRRWPAGFVKLARMALLHDDPHRFRRVHRLARRIAQDRQAWADVLDADRAQLERMAAQVRREIHKMHAFVRFRRVADGGHERHVAWFDPRFDIVRAAAPFFADRFAAMHWAILTPRGSVCWDRCQLQFGPPSDPGSAPRPDDGESLWLAYYASIFNPARLNVAMMTREMPRRYWINLPEAALIDTLVMQAPNRVHAMASVQEASRLRRGRAFDGIRGPEQHDGPAGLQAIRQGIERCDRCELACHATQAVPGIGTPGARLMIVGEQPGDREDLEGRPFVGPAGQVLQRAIDALGWSRDNLFLTNAVKHFKFNWVGRRRMHKTAAQHEQAACADWLDAEIEAVQPRAFVALGATAASSLLGRNVPVLRMEGQWLERSDGRAVLVVRHPSALLRAQGAPFESLQQSWRDMLDRATPIVSA